MKFRKKPVVIEAEQFVEGRGRFLPFIGLGAPSPVQWSPEGKYWYIHTLEGAMIVSDLDWVIKGIRGEFYPCKPDIFEATYEAVDDNIHCSGHEYRGT